MFVLRASILNNQQKKKINLLIDSGFKVLHEQKQHTLKVYRESQEPANKKTEKQLRFYSTKKQKIKASKEQWHKLTLSI